MFTLYSEYFNLENKSCIGHDSPRRKAAAAVRIVWRASNTRLFSQLHRHDSFVPSYGEWYIMVKNVIPLELFVAFIYARQSEDVNMYQKLFTFNNISSADCEFEWN